MKITKALEAEIKNFVEYHPTDRVKSNLQRLLMGYLQAHDDYPGYHKQLLADLEGLHDLLDAIDDGIPADQILMAKRVCYS